MGPQTSLSILLLSTIAISGTFAQHQVTHLMVQNLAQEDIITTIVTDVDEFDWSGNSGPQHNFEDIQIPAGTYHQQQEDVYSLATNCPFSMILIFSDDTRDTYRINMKYALDDSQAAFQHLEGTRDVTYSRVGDNVLLIDVRDNGTYCV
ncbi:uncharacterized protein LOC135139433 [Zophobas morio]